MKAKILAVTLLGLAAVLSYAIPQAKAGWGGTPFSCGSGDATLKITWEPVTNNDSAIITGEDASDPAESPYGITDADTHLTKKPTLRYNFRNPIIDPMDANYKLSRRFEMSVVGRKNIRTYLMANFRAEKGPMQTEDLGTPESQANVSFFSYRGVEMYKLTTKTRDVKKLKPATFMGIMKGVVRKHQKMLRDEVKEWKAWTKKQEAEDKKAGIE